MTTAWSPLRDVRCLVTTVYSTTRPVRTRLMHTFTGMGALSANKHCPHFLYHTLNQSCDGADVSLTGWTCWSRLLCEGGLWWPVSWRLPPSAWQHIGSLLVCRGSYPLNCTRLCKTHHQRPKPKVLLCVRGETTHTITLTQHSQVHG